MAFVINPDGTVRPIAVEYDRAGNMHPKRIYNIDNSVASGYSRRDWQQTESTTINPKKKKRNKKKKCKAIINSKAPVQQPERSNPVITKPVTQSHQGERLEPIHIEKFMTRQSIDEYFDKQKRALRPVPKYIYLYVKSILKYNLWDHFEKRHKELNLFLAKLKSIMDEGIGRGKKRNKSKTKEVKWNDSRRSVERGGMNRTGRTPQYGYARDIFGRVKERDHYDEDKRNEFKQAQRRQSNYDFSNFDLEDDHDSYYDSNYYD